MKARLTERQNEAYEFIRSFMRRHRKPPTLHEIGAALGIRSTNGVFKLLQALEQKGYISRTQHEARGLALTESDDPFSLDDALPNLLVVSRTASDQPALLRHRPSGALSVDPYFLKGVRDPDRCLIGRTGDDGMNGAGIRKGDFILVEEVPWNELRNGETAAFLVGEEMHVRFFVLANGRLHLRPSDRTYTEETFTPEDPRCYVVGRVIGVMRRL